MFRPQGNSRIRTPKDVIYWENGWPDSLTSVRRTNTQHGLTSQHTVVDSNTIEHSEHATFQHTWIGCSNGMHVISHPELSHTFPACAAVLPYICRFAWVSNVYQSTKNLLKEIGRNNIKPIKWCELELGRPLLPCVAIGWNCNFGPVIVTITVLTPWHQQRWVPHTRPAQYWKHEKNLGWKVWTIHQRQGFLLFKLFGGTWYSSFYSIPLLLLVSWPY